MSKSDRVTDRSPLTVCYCYGLPIPRDGREAAPGPALEWTVRLGRPASITDRAGTV